MALQSLSLPLLSLLHSPCRPSVEGGGGGGDPEAQVKHQASGRQKTGPHVQQHQVAPQGVLPALQRQAGPSAGERGLPLDMMDDSGG